MTPLPTLYITRCKHCTHKFEAPPLSIPVLGQPITLQAVKYVQALAKHMAKHHPKEDAAAQMAGQHMYAIECLKHFSVEDPSILSTLDGVRRALHLATRAVFITDAMIQDVVARLEFNQSDSAKALEAMKELRDVLLDMRAPKQSALVHPNGN